MTVKPTAIRLGITWSPQSRGELRGIDRHTALTILRCLDRFLLNREGDVKKLQPPSTGTRLRCGDYRVIFDHDTADHIFITRIRHRREAYR